MGGQPPSTLPQDDDKRPVEFNHAISYVNKIKNRFASQPDIYKQFLEILQTYQRESKPIQDVYVQVTRLFDSAPDLLDDFKQFLPDTTSPTKQARLQLDDPAPLSDVRGDPHYRPVSLSQSAMQHPNMADANRLPPVGTFAPTPLSKDSKRKRIDKFAPPAESPGDLASFGSASATCPVSSNKTKAGALKQTPGSVTFPLSPTLIPALPEPLAPSRTLMPLPDELSFFDRVKKFIGNRHSFNEFLKLLHLFNKDLIDKTLLVYRAHAYIGGNPDLYDWFKKFVQFDDSDVLDIRSKPSFGRVALANCRGLGPSYRLLPKRQTHASCQGRDTLCRSVLNDKWISHPTWASEDSGFVAHRKNIYEEGLHRIEEERHDYDFNIEAISRTIQLLQPLAQSLRVMSPSDRQSFTLDPGLGGQSHTIYQRSIKRLYGRERGKEVISDLFRRPYAVIPPLLNRLQSKCEDWKAAQREWEKVWREQTQRIFWKSLDHQHAQQKNADKRQFQAKTLYTEIQVKYEEQRRRREVNKIPHPSYQLSFSFVDQDVVLDAAHLLLVHVGVASNTDFTRLQYFLKDFIPLFFGIDPQGLEARIAQAAAIRSDACSTQGPNDTSLPEDFDESHSGHRPSHPGALISRDTNGITTAPASVSSSSVAGDDKSEDVEPVSQSSSDPYSDIKSRVWIHLPSECPQLSQVEEQAMQPFRRSVFSMYCNLPIYCFFRTFVTFYERLLNIKNDEGLVRDLVRRGQAAKPARDLRMLDKVPEDFWSDASSSANYYTQVLAMFEDHIHGDLPMPFIEETLRRYYLQHGWQLYSFDKLLQALARFAMSVVTEESKERTYDIYQLFKKDRVRDRGTFQDELHYRKLVERYTKDGDVFRISFNPSTRKAFVSILKPEDSTVDVHRLETERRWNYYVSTYQTLDPTEGIDYNSLSVPFLRRNIPLEEEINDEFMDSVLTGRSDDKLEVRICLENYRLNFSPQRQEWWIASPSIRLVSRLEASRQASNAPAPFLDEVAHSRFVSSPSWMAEHDSSFVSERLKKFADWVGDARD